MVVQYVGGTIIEWYQAKHDVGVEKPDAQKHHLEDGLAALLVKNGALCVCVARKYPVYVMLHKSLIML